MLSLLGSQIIAMVGLGGGSFLLGIFPLCFNSVNLRRWPLCTSAALCFGAGVLLATAIVHMLPEIREDLNKLAEPVFCAGFFLLYFLDEIVHYFWTDALDNQQCAAEASRRSSDSHTHANNTGVMSSHVPHYGSTAKHDHDQFLRPATDTHCRTEASTSLLCHTNYKEPCPNSATGRVGLFVALTAHSLLEGLAIGLQDTSAKVMLLVGAVACHKLVVALCLGIELASSAVGKCKHISQMLIFALGCAGGIGIGMGITQTQDTWKSFTIPILQAIAGGTLLYVTVCEILPRERARWHHQTQNRAAGILQFLSVATGFCLILVLNMLFVETSMESQIGSN